MPTFEHAIEIAAPVDHVFAFVTDPANWSRTNPSLTGVEVIERSDRGARVRATYRMLGLSSPTEIEQTIVETNTHTSSTFESDDMSGEMDWYFVDTDDGTDVRLHVEYTFGTSLFNRVLTPVARRYNDRQLRQVLRTTKDLLEAEREVEAAPTVQA